MNFTGSSRMENRLNFAQTGKITRLDMLLNRKGKHLSNQISSGFDYLFDSSNLESELKPYKNRTAMLGYSLQYIPLDSLTLDAGIKAYYRDEQDRYADDRRFVSKGLEQQLYGYWQTGDLAKSLNLHAGWQNKELDREAFNLYSAGINGNYDNATLLCNFSVNAGRRWENIYTLIPPDTINLSHYAYSDRQAKQYVDSSLLFALPYDNRFNFSLSDQYSLRQLSMEQNKTKDNGDFDNLAQIVVNYEVMPQVMLQFNGRHSYYIKALKQSKNSRLMESRVADTRLTWEYSPGDSLLANYTLELRRTAYPDANHLLDNDYLNRIIALSWTFYWKERLKLRNRLLYLIKDEIFIDSWLSANNNTATSLQWQPECALVLGDSFIFRQAYQIRADYDDYYYNSYSEIQDNFYRQATASYHLIYDSSPLLSRLIDSRWAYLPFRSRNSEPVRIDISYDIERNETGTKSNQDFYYLADRSIRQSAGLLLQKQYGIGVYQLQPKYTWGDWQEYSLAMSAIFQLNQFSSGEISINPVGETLETLDWKISCSVNLLF